MFAVYEGLEKGNRFISNYKGNGKDCELTDGTVAYKILYTAETTEQCQEYISGVHKNVFTFTIEEKEIVIRGLRLLIAIWEKNTDPEQQMTIMKAKQLLYLMTLG